MTMCLVDIITE